VNNAVKESNEIFEMFLKDFLVNYNSRKKSNLTQIDLDFNQIINLDKTNSKIFQICFEKIMSDFLSLFKQKIKDIKGQLEAQRIEVLIFAFYINQVKHNGKKLSSPQFNFQKFYDEIERKGNVAFLIKNIASFP
jgi:Leucine-rich repeat (LRR) protein